MIYRLSYQYAHALKHFLSTRSLEVFALQASPVLGCFLGGFTFEWNDVCKLSLLILGSVSLTFHIFVFNDWAGYATDSFDPNRKGKVFSCRNIASEHVANIAVFFLGLAICAFSVLGLSVLLQGVAIALLGLLYSCSPVFGKVTPIAASLNHLIGGILHFLLGYTLFNDLDVRGIAISSFFGLVFAGGHLNQEVRDYDGDHINGIRTSAVAFGCKRTFIASTLIFATAYGVIISLALTGLLPKALSLSIIPFVLHILWSLQTVQKGLRFEDVLWIQRRYRLLFAAIGLAMFI